MLEKAALLLGLVALDMVGSIMPAVIAILLAYFWKKPANGALPGSNILKVTVATWVMIYVVALLVLLAAMQAQSSLEDAKSLSLAVSFFFGVWFARTRITAAREKYGRIITRRA